MQAIAPSMELSTKDPSILTFKDPPFGGFQISEECLNWVWEFLSNDKGVAGSPNKPEDGCDKFQRRDKEEGDALWIPPGLYTVSIMDLILFHKARGAEKDEEAFGAFRIFSFSRYYMKFSWKVCYLFRD
ncbi:uncharacterized protein LOC115662908 isoform X2 [Syzygium oleosum]|uniref:uncharacterized protein LOC115662908 isoform X2 n=1 Tax=Syzygium oleosum TaxID=219896 RepID=UPI0024BB3EEB|nr:uncharacterized protein LOC115662908 isoform X2 [Syzygium oleosum]